MRRGLERLLRPTSIAVVGASERPGSYGGQTLLNLETLGFAGEVWAVNPRRDEVLGRPCVPSIADLPVAVDAVVVAIPAAGVPEVVEAAGARGCGGAVVISAGFGESVVGVERQRDLVAAADRHGLPVCGPNGNGIVALHSRAALWGDAVRATEPGAVALVSQSGNLAVNALTSRRGIRFHTIVASGNQAVVPAADYVEFLAGAEGVASVALYLEDDGGPSLCDALAACAQGGTRVVVLKVGTSHAGAASAAAHTAAVAGDQRIFRSLIEEAGAVWAEDAHELLELAKTLAFRPRLPHRPGIAFMTCSGGDSAQAADEAHRRGLHLPALADSTVAALAEVVPDAATVSNPLDYTAILWGEGKALSELVFRLGSDPAIDQVLVFYDQYPGLVGAAEEAYRSVRQGIADGAARSPAATMICSTLPELLDDAGAWEFAQAGVPAAAGLRTGLRCLAAMADAPGDPQRLREIAAAAREVGRGVGGHEDGGWLSERQAKAMLAAHGIPVLETMPVHSEHDVITALDRLGTIALKLEGPGLLHKSELGGVVLGLAAPSDAVLAYRRLRALAEDHGGRVFAERMAPPGVELLVAARADAVVPAVVVGIGGIWTEMLADVAVVPLPASAERVEAAMRTLRGAPLLFGGRGQPPLDTAAAARLAQRVGELLREQPLELVELNPVLVDERGAVAVDAMIRRRAEAVVRPAREEVARSTT